MEMTESIKKYKEKIFQGRDSELLETDPEFMERFEHFAFSEVVNETKLDDKIGFMAVLAALLGCQGEEAFRELLSAAVNIGKDRQSARWRTAGRQGHGCKWRSLGKECGIFGSQGLRRAGISIVGWPQTVLVIITREPGLTTNKGR